MMSFIDLPKDPEDLVRWTLEHGKVDPPGVLHKVQQEVRAWLLNLVRTYPEMVTYDYLTARFAEVTKIRVYVGGSVWGAVNDVETLELFRAITGNCKVIEDDDWHD